MREHRTIQVGINVEPERGAVPLRPRVRVSFNLGGEPAAWAEGPPEMMRELALRNAESILSYQFDTALERWYGMVPDDVRPLMAPTPWGGGAGEIRRQEG